LGHKAATLSFIRFFGGVFLLIGGSIGMPQLSSLVLDLRLDVLRRMLDLIDHARVLTDPVPDLTGFSSISITTSSSAP
jgi:hypothetical protein